MRYYSSEFRRPRDVWTEMARDLLEVPTINRGEWQSQKADHPLQHTHELTNVVYEMAIPMGVGDLQALYQPNLPWAEDHFLERVSGEPLNPPPSEQWWPWAVQGNEAHKSEEKFSHTYPERFWPKRAGIPSDYPYPEGLEDMRGIRFKYGDLGDVVNQLGRTPLTRQAYLPVWFPEDTGAVHKERVPCTLGYHFLVRSSELQITYFIRSCDFVRHFHDDAYMAARLAQWVCLKVRNQHRVTLQPRLLTMHMVSFHCFAGDAERLTRMYDL